MNLRPHHLLCIQKFIGYGYNEEFTSNIESIVSELTKNQNTITTFTQKSDDICKSCPNNLNGVCRSNEKVSIMDEAVLKICDFSYGENITWEKASLKAREFILKSKEFDNICASCQWFGLCKNKEV